MDKDALLLKIAEDIASLKTGLENHLESHRARYKLQTFILSGLSFLTGLIYQYFTLRG
jgi:hypothetical protein